MAAGPVLVAYVTGAVMSGGKVGWDGGAVSAGWSGLSGMRVGSMCGPAL